MVLRILGWSYDTTKDRLIGKSFYHCMISVRFRGYGRESEKEFCVLHATKPFWNPVARLTR